MNWIVKCVILGVLIGLGASVIHYFVGDGWPFIVLIAILSGAVAYGLERFMPDRRAEH